MMRKFKNLMNMVDILLITIYTFQFGLNGGKILSNGKYSKTLKVRVDPELYNRLKKEAKKYDTDVQTYVRWCIQTGIYLDDLNTFVRTCGDESDEFKITR